MPVLRQNRILIHGQVDVLAGRDAESDVALMTTCAFVFCDQRPHGWIILAR